MNFIDSNHNDHKKRYSAIIETLKNNLIDLHYALHLKNVLANSNFEVAMNSQACF